MKCETKIKASGLSDIGRFRPNNEDRFFIQILSKPENNCDNIGIFLVCDGIGGAVAGEEASSIAVETISQILIQKITNPHFSLFEFPIQNLMQEAVLEANRQILEIIKQEPFKKGMGTTVVLALALENLVFYGHIGDSRLYYISDNRIFQMTRDHTLFNYLAEEKLDNIFYFYSLKQKNVLLQVLGQENVKLDYGANPILMQKGDYLLLCSDGLTLHLLPEEMLEIIKKYEEPAIICSKMIDLANKKGGKDNITVIVARFCD